MSDSERYVDENLVKIGRLQEMVCYLLHKQMFLEGVIDNLKDELADLKNELATEIILGDTDLKSKSNN